MKFTPTSLIRRMLAPDNSIEREQSILAHHLNIIEQIVPEDSKIGISWIENLLNGDDLENRLETLQKYFDAEERSIPLTFEYTQIVNYVKDLHSV